MKRKVYKSIDHRAEFFGIRGRYLYLTFLLIALDLVVAITVGTAVSMLAGVGTGIAGALAAYFLVLSLEGKVGERHLLKVIVKRGYPTLYRVRPKHVRNIWRGFNLPAGQQKGH